MHPATSAAVGAPQLSLAQSLLKLITFELALKRPWLDTCSSSALEQQQDDEEELEVARLAQNCRHSSHARAKLLLDGLLALSTMRLSREQPAAARSLLALGVVEPRATRPAASWWPISELRRPANVAMALVFALTLYVTLTIFQVALVVLQHDIALTNLRPRSALARRQQQQQPLAPECARLNQSLFSAAFVAPQSEACTLAQLLDRGAAFDERAFLELNRQLDAWGMPVRSQLGAIFLALSIVGSAPFIFYALAQAFLLARRSPVRLDAVAFLHEPLLERARLQREQQRIVHKHIETFADSCALNDRASPSRKSPPPFSAFEWRPPSRGERRQLGAPECREFLRILGAIRDAPTASVRPLVAHSEWHYVKQRCAPLMMLACVAISFGTPMATTALSAIIELYLRVQQRLQGIACARWHPDGVPLEQGAHLNTLTGDQLRPYELYDGSWTQLARLMLAVELDHFADWTTVGFALKMALLIFFLSAWSSLWTTIYILSFLDKIAWLLQLRGQLEWCTRAARTLAACASVYDRREECESVKVNHFKQTRPATSSKPDAWSSDDEQVAKGRNSNGSLSDLSQLRALFLRRATSALVNLELYRSQRRPFQLLTNFLLLQAGLFTSTSILLLYLIATNIETRNEAFAAFSSLCIIGYFNIYLVLASYSSKLMEGLMHELMRMLAPLARQPKLVVLPALASWRRQLLSDREMSLFASTRVFGFAVCYKKIVAFNAHLVGVWLILFRVLGAKHGL